jgi:hypothetical protein
MISRLLFVITQTLQGVLRIIHDLLMQSQPVYIQLQLSAYTSVPVPLFLNALHHDDGTISVDGHLFVNTLRKVPLENGSTPLSCVMSGMRLVTEFGVTI